MRLLFEALMVPRSVGRAIQKLSKSGNAEYGFA